MIVCLCMHCFLSLKWYKKQPVTLTFFLVLIIAFFITISGGYNLKQNNSLNILIKFQTLFEKNDEIFICNFHLLISDVGWSTFLFIHYFCFFSDFLQLLSISEACQWNWLVNVHFISLSFQHASFI